MTRRSGLRVEGDGPLLRPVVDGEAVNADAAWYYPAPKDAAAKIAGRVAFWRGVTVERLGRHRLGDRRGRVAITQAVVERPREHQLVVKDRARPERGLA